MEPKRVADLLNTIAAICKTLHFQRFVSGGFYPATDVVPDSPGSNEANFAIHGGQLGWKPRVTRELRHGNRANTRWVPLAWHRRGIGTVRRHHFHGFQQGEYARAPEQRGDSFDGGPRRGAMDWHAWRRHHSARAWAVQDVQLARWLIEQLHLGSFRRSRTICGLAPTEEGSTS